MAAFLETSRDDDGLQQRQPAPKCAMSPAWMKQWEKFVLADAPRSCSFDKHLAASNFWNLINFYSTTRPDQQPAAPGKRQRRIILKAQGRLLSHIWTRFHLPAEFLWRRTQGTEAEILSAFFILLKFRISQVYNMVGAQPIQPNLDDEESEID